MIAPQHLDAFKTEEQHFHDELSESARAGSVVGRNSSFHWHFLHPMMDLPDQATILEVACGTRADGIELAQTRKLVTSVDISPSAVEHARELARRSDVSDRIRFLAADAEHLPFPDASFDASFVAASFHHFPNQPVALREMRRVTKPGGFVIWGVEPASWPYRTVLKLLAPVKRYIRAHRERKHNSIADDTTEGYTKKQIIELFDQAGLRIIDLRPVKLFSEFYDSGVRLFGRLTKRSVRSSRTIDHALAKVDDLLAYIPGATKLYWHFNVISRVPDSRS